MISGLLVIFSYLWVTLLLTVPGGFTVLAAWRKGWLPESRGWPELIFLSFLGSFSLFSLSALASAQLGIFSIHLVGVVLLLYSFLVLLLLRPGPVRVVPSAGRPAETRRVKFPALILSLILLLSGLLYFRPTEYIFGGWDPGVYIGTGAHIARTGSILVEDRDPGFLSPRERSLFSRKHSFGYPEKYPGFRRAGPEGTRLIPQFYHLYPVLLAAAFFPSGLSGGFYLTPLLGTLSLLSIYLLVRELWGKPEGLMAAALIGVNRVQVWQARFPTAEMLSQFLLFSGLFLLARHLDRQERYPAVLAGVFLGLFMLSHISALLLLPVLLAYFYCRWFIDFRRGDLYFLLPFLVLTIYSILPHFFYGREYASLALRRFNWHRPVPLLLVMLAGFGLSALRLAGRGFRRRLSSILSGSSLRWLGVLALVFIAVYAYFIRPFSPSLSADKTSLVELGWFLTRPGLVLALAGIGLALLINRRSAVWLFLLLTITFSFLFLWRQLISPYYMWAARRFAVVIIPGFLIGAAFFLGFLLRSRRRPLRLAAFLLLAVLVLLGIRKNRVLFTHREYRSAVSFIDELASRVRDADLVAVSAAVDKLPAPLDLVYGLPVLPIYRESPGQWETAVELVRRRFPDDPAVYLLAEGEPPALPGVVLRPEGKLIYHVPLLERSGVHIPSRLDYAAPDGRIEVWIFRLAEKED